MFIPKSGILTRKQMVYDKEAQAQFIEDFLIRANNQNETKEVEELIDCCDCAKEIIYKDIPCIPDTKESSFNYKRKVPQMHFCRMFNLQCSRKIWEEHQELKSKT